ncbi:hypothetical protein [Dictyobacter aurantiacus]|uniref:Uncharacterized protein n=1 Tax=Dictyobacter aurantiacus TaxID=1936993 RepID=A0A401ZQE8_9CHLR|nr:hypothetical protein [Dictyobacter aurantiacus]GCE09040.1 hypothetical protein KDAU_63690 [Dictyobacter aurantiacus]
MPLELLFFLCLQFIFIIINFGVGMIGFARSRKVLQESLTTPNQEGLPIHGFMRYITRRNRVVRQSNTMNALVLVSGIVLLGISFVQMPDLLVHGQIVAINNNDSQTFINFVIIVFLGIFCAPLLGLSIGGNIAILLINIFVDVHAIEFFHVSSLSRQAFAAVRLKYILSVSLPLIILLESVTLIATLTGQSFSILIVILTYIIAIVCMRTFFGARLLKAVNNLQPIEQTSWAYLQPRIVAWSRLAGVEFREVLIQADALGTNIRIRGRQKPVLILGEWLLRYTDWRQQDAMLCIEIALVRKKVLTWSLWRTICLLTSFSILIGLFIVLQMDGGLLDVLTLTTSVFLTLLVVLLINRFFRKKMHALYQDADCIACYFTGDPMAAMVALTTVQALNGVQSTQSTVTIPSANNRLQQLDQLARQPWPRAPYASKPVPAITPVMFGPYQLSTSIDQQSEPAPLPTAPYVPLV